MFDGVLIATEFSFPASALIKNLKDDFNRTDDYDDFRPQLPLKEHTKPRE